MVEHKTDAELAELFYMPVQSEPKFQAIMHTYYKKYFTRKRPCIFCEMDKKVAVASDIAIEKMADALQEIVAKGKIKVEEIPELVTAGVDQVVIDRWSAKYNSPAIKVPATGLTCCKCKEYYPYADAANQPDGTFKCFGCRR